jgi:hypothetical protein
LGEEHRSWSFSLWSLLYYPVTSSFLCPNIGGNMTEKQKYEVLG